MAKPIGPNFFVGYRVTPGMVIDDQIFKNLPKNFENPRNFFIKSAKCFVFVLLTRRTPMFTNEIKDGREAP